MEENSLNEAASAAVALIVTTRSPSVLLVRRAEHPHDPWSGQWALPGGRHDQTDRDLIHTCMREAEEECGCVLEMQHFVGSLPITHAGRRSQQAVRVAPFVWHIPEKVELTPDRQEITTACWQDISWLKNPDNHQSGRIAPYYSDREFPYVLIQDAPLWGFTYKVLMSYLRDDPVS